MQIFTEKEFIDWVKDQPDERPVRMETASLAAPCGCVLAEFLKDKGFCLGTVGVRGFLTQGREHKVKIELRTFKGDYGPNIFNYFNYFDESRSNYGSDNTFGRLKKSLNPLVIH